ncbi:MAG: hypothetical protein SFT94_10835 [Pseudanabaenaceae cyanobacterium bins.68]|nr:hypothetical protein [Pseudanabaenaceae cyanobacterium bins.68]
MKIPRREEATARFWTTIYSECIKKANVRVPFDNLDNGTRVLNSLPECDRYIALFGGHHFHKLYSAFSNTNFEYTQDKSLEIIDWGCGQAVATSVLIDYLIEKNITPNVTSITLIEPSSLALERGREFIVRMFSNDLEVESILNPINKYIGELEESDLKDRLSSYSEDNLKLHLFSNILDVEEIDIEKLYNLISNSFSGINRIICTSPRGSLRLEEFYRHFSNTFRVANSSSDNTAINADIYNVISGNYTGHTISRCERQFTVYLSNEKL